MNIHTIFHSCCQWLQDYAISIGSNYEELNVWLFCIIIPCVFALLVISNVLSFIWACSKKPVNIWKLICLGIFLFGSFFPLLGLLNMFLSAMSYIV